MLALWIFIVLLAFQKVLSKCERRHVIAIYMCIDGKSERCINAEFTDDWDEFDVRKGHGDKKRRRNGPQTGAKLRAMVRKRLGKKGRKTKGPNPGAVQNKQLRMSDEPKLNGKKCRPSTRRKPVIKESYLISKRPVRKCRMQSQSDSIAVPCETKTVKHTSQDRACTNVSIKQKINGKKSAKSSLIKNFDAV